MNPTSKNWRAVRKTVVQTQCQGHNKRDSLPWAPILKDALEEVKKEIGVKIVSQNASFCHS